jgi:hypothetical protein
VWSKVFIQIYLIFTRVWFSYSYRKKLLDQILLEVLIKFFTKIILSQGLNLWSQLVYFLYMLDLVIHNVRDYTLQLDQIFFDILIELFTKIIKIWGLRLWSQFVYFLHGFDLDQNPLKILIEHCTKLIKTQCLWDYGLNCIIFYMGLI